MNKNPTIIAGIVTALLGVLIILPILVDGTRSSLFTVLFWVLAVTFTFTLVLVMMNRRQQH